MYFIAVCKLYNLRILFLLSSMKMDHVSFIITNKINISWQYINWMIHCHIILSDMSLTFKIGYFMTMFFFLKINNVHVSLQSWDIFIFLFYLPMSLYSMSELPSNSSKFNPAFWVLKRCHFSISQERFTTMLVHILLVIRMTILTSLIHATPLWQGCFHSSYVYVSPWNRNIK